MFKNKDIPIRCKGSRYVAFKELLTFQGNLKELSTQNALKLRGSILAHGWIAPVFVWRKKHILDGHGRMLVLGELLREGYTIGKLPVVDIEADSKSAAGKILLAINSKYQTITEQGLYEFMAEMDLTLPDLQGYELPDIDMPHFDAGYFQDVADADDEVPPLPRGKPLSQAGEVYQLGSHRLLCGDAQDSEAISRLMSGRQAAMVFTDPPYGVNYAEKNKFLNTLDGNNRIEAAMMGDDLDIEETKKLWLAVFKNMLEVTKSGGSCYVFYSNVYTAETLEAIKSAGWIQSQILIWAKNHFIFGRQDYMNKYEPFFYGWKKGGHEFYGEANQTTIWEFDRPAKAKLHPTMKPVALCLRAINNSSKKGEIVFDPFLGSGSTLIASEIAGRACYGVEIDPHYCDVIRARYEQHVSSK